MLHPFLFHIHYQPTTCKTFDLFVPNNYVGQKGIIFSEIILHVIIILDFEISYITIETFQLLKENTGKIKLK